MYGTFMAAHVGTFIGYGYQGCCASGKPGKIREFDFALEILEKSGNFTPLSGKTIFFQKLTLLFILASEI